MESKCTVFGICSHTCDEFLNLFVSQTVFKDCYWCTDYWGFPGGSEGKESACNVGDPGSIPGSGRSSGERNGYPL